MPRYAAVDIGSNSIRMMAAEVTQTGTRVLASERQISRLGESVFRQGRISNEALDLAAEILGRMAALYQKLDIAAVRAVATSAVRDTSNQQEFLAVAGRALGVPVEIISGQEEARLIHAGVQARWPHPKDRILIVDVGGGSAELIVSDRGQLDVGVSKPLGAVRLKEVFLQNDPPTAKELERMETYIDEKIAPDWKRLQGQTYQRMIGTSASAAALVCAVNGIPRARREEADRQRATYSQIRKFYRDIVKLDVVARRKISGVGPRRAEILIAGTAVFLKIMQALELEEIYYSGAGVRDGIVADLAARGAGREVSSLNAAQRRTVEELARKFSVPLRHGRKVAELSQKLFTGLEELHRLPHAFGRLLEAAAYLHDAGHFIADTGHHKHSYYVVSHADLPGFTANEKEIVAMLCRYHRKSMPSQRHESYQALPADVRQAILLLTPLLRLSDSLDQRQEQRVDGLRCEVWTNEVEVQLAHEGDVEMEVWAAERAAAGFEQVYGRRMAIARRQQAA